MKDINNDVYHTYIRCAFAGLLNAFLSWKFFTPLSHLTYSIYVLHISCTEVYIKATKSVIQNDDMEKVSEV